MKKILVALVALGFAVCGSYAEDRVVLSEELAPIRESVASVVQRVDTHTASTNNPHGVTLRQVYDADVDGGNDFIADSLGLTVNEGNVMVLRGDRGHRIDFYEGTVEGPLSFIDRPTYSTNGYLVTDSELAANSPALTALTNALGQRVSEFETIHLNWNFTNAATATTNIHYLDPTTIPTRHLYLYVNASGYTDTNVPCKVYVGNPETGYPYPSKPLTIEIMPFAAYGMTNAVVDIGMGTGMGVTYKPNGTYRKCVFSYWPEVGLWEFECAAISTYPTSFRTSRAQAQTTTVEGFSTVEEWAEWRKQQPW